MKTKKITKKLGIEKDTRTIKKENVILRKKLAKKLLDTNEGTVVESLMNNYERIFYFNWSMNNFKESLKSAHLFGWNFFLGKSTGKLCLRIDTPLCSFGYSWRPKLKTK